MTILTIKDAIDVDTRQRNRTKTEGQHSPWGLIQHATEHLQGMTTVVTAGHGGVYLSPAANLCIPLSMRRDTWNGGQGLRGWYEEDCDAIIPWTWFWPALRHLDGVNLEGHDRSLEYLKRHLCEDHSPSGFGWSVRSVREFLDRMDDPKSIRTLPRVE